MAGIKPGTKPLIHEHQVIIFSWVLLIDSCSSLVSHDPWSGQVDSPSCIWALSLDNRVFGVLLLLERRGREMDQRRPGAGGASPASPDELGSWLVRSVVETCCRSFMNELMVCSEDDLSIYFACQLLISYYSWHVMVTSSESLINLALAVLK